MIPPDWLAARPEPDRHALEELDRRIRAAAPGLAPTVAGDLVGYGPFRYRYASGREGASFLVAITASKTGCAVYVNAVDAGGYLVEQAAAALGKVKIGRSCVRFKKLADVDLDALERVIAAAVRVGGTSAVPPP
ncbi:MAG: DUF1801 domain-containing protein [Myxococcota bacterium]